MNADQVSVAASSPKPVVVIEETPPVASVWLSRICWAITALIVIGAMADSADYSLQLHRAGSPVEHLEATMEHSNGISQATIAAATFAILAMLFNLRAKVTHIANSFSDRWNTDNDAIDWPGGPATTRPDPPPSAPSLILEELRTIRAELAWQRQQKEKEIHRAKAAAAKHAPSDGA